MRPADVDKARGVTDQRDSEGSNWEGKCSVSRERRSKLSCCLAF